MPANENHEFFFVCNIVKSPPGHKLFKLLMFISDIFLGGPDYTKIIPFICPVYMYSLTLFEFAHFINTFKNVVHRMHIDLLCSTI